LIKAVIKWYKTIYNLNTYKKIGSWLLKTLKEFGKGLKDAFINAIAGMIDGVLEDVPDWLRGPLEKIRAKLPATSGGSSSSTPAPSPSSSSSSSGLSLNFDFGGGGGSAAIPSSSYGSYGSSPAAVGTQGIRTNPGVKLSAQTVDFIKRAGLTQTVTSGMDGGWTGVHKIGKDFSRSHASGNKFDYGISAAISPTALASELRKMLSTPGIKEIRTERIPNYTVETARAILEQEGFKTKGILFNDGYPSYATGPHLDVLIDPKFSGVQGSANQGLTTDTSMASSSNPYIAQFTTGLKANVDAALGKYTELLSEVLAPDILNAANSKDTAAMLANAISGNSDKGVTFNKKNDITDGNLAALQLVGLM
jgi:hypothetical protein